jgi:predicted transcriptional regulator
MTVVAGAVIREARRPSGLSQAELAPRAKVSQPVNSAYESGQREPGLATITLLVTELDPTDARLDPYRERWEIR